MKKRVKKVTFCKDCPECVPDEKNLNNKGKIFMAKCPKTGYSVLLNHGFCER